MSGAGQSRDGTGVSRRWEMAALVVILLLAAVLRFYRLDSIPPGLTHDEADFSHDAIAVYHGSRPLYVATYGYQDEPLMHYASALVMLVAGPSYVAVRATAALFGVLLVLLTFLWARTAFGSTVALLAAAWLAVSTWPVATSRFALQVEPTASVAVLANLFLWLAMGLGTDGEGSAPRQRWRPAVHWVLFALCVALSIYAYEASRVTWILFPLFGATLAAARPDLVRRDWWKLLAALAAAAALALPLLTHPAAWDRVGRLAGPLEALRSGSFGPILASARQVLGMFTFSGDPFVTYNVPGRPILDPVTGLFFYAGVLLCLWRWRRPACVFALLWLLVGTAPSMLSGLHSATLRSIVAQPVVSVLPAVALAEAVDWAARRFRPRRAVLPVLAMVLLILAGGGLVTAREYFVRWANLPATREAYFSDLVQALYAVDADSSDRLAVLSTPFPNLPHDPYVAQVMPAQHDADIRWVDGRGALLLPPISAARLVVLSRAPLDPLLREALVGEPVALVPVEGTDEFFEVLDWDPASTLEVLRATCAETMLRLDGGASLPVDLGHSVQLVGYALEPSVVAPGGTVRLTTLWHVLSPDPLGPVLPGLYGHDAAVFAHLLDGDSQVVAQQDRLDFPAWDWRPGDTFVQLHTLEIPPDLSAGRYDLEAGLYTRPDLRRLQVMVDGEARGDRVLLRPVEVALP
jgi:hypothetical protein